MFNKLSITLALLLVFGVNSYELNNNEHNVYWRFAKFIDKYQKNYLDDYKTFANKFEVFHENIKFIESHNEKYKSGKYSYYLDEGPFTDMSLEEFNSTVLSEYNSGPLGCSTFKYNQEIYPESLDWREKMAVTAVKNQGQCGSCWSFSTTGAIEGLTAIKNNNLVELSEQQLVDCSKANHGCNGGLMTMAFKYVAKIGGICSEDEYQYTAKDGQCKECESVEGTDIKDCHEIESGDSEGLIYSLSNQPISVGIQADTPAFQHYGGGVFTDTKCYTGQIDHGVLLVAYDKGTMTIKNSWGASWGDKGYITIARTDDDVGICGVYTSASFPTF